MIIVVHNPRSSFLLGRVNVSFDNECNQLYLTFHVIFWVFLDLILFALGKIIVQAEIGEERLFAF